MLVTLVFRATNNFHLGPQHSLGRSTACHTPGSALAAACTPERSGGTPSNDDSHGLEARKVAKSLLEVSGIYGFVKKPYVLQTWFGGSTQRQGQVAEIGVVLIVYYGRYFVGYCRLL